MNKLILSLALLFVGISCTNGAIYCYYCSNCPNPFNPRGPGVTVITSNTGFCLKQSVSSDPSYPSSRGGAPPGLCVVAGCRWIYDSTGRQIYNCCCNSNYCNANM